MENSKINIVEAKNKYQILIKNSNFDEINNFNNDLIPKKLILSQFEEDVNSFHITQKQYETLIKTMKQFGEKCFYIYLSEGYKNNEFILTEEDSLISLNKNISYEEYNNLEILLENVIYSSKKNWAIILTMEDYEILGATEEFMNEYKKNYPNWKEDIEKFKYYFDAPNFNLTVVEKIFNYVTENADDLTMEEKTLPWKNK